MLSTQMNFPIPSQCQANTLRGIRCKNACKGGFCTRHIRSQGRMCTSFIYPADQKPVKFVQRKVQRKSTLTRVQLSQERTRLKNFLTFARAATMEQDLPFLPAEIRKWVYDFCQFRACLCPRGCSTISQKCCACSDRRKNNIHKVHIDGKGEMEKEFKRSHWYCLLCR